MDPKLSTYFKYTEKSTHANRLAHYFAHLASESGEEWIGKGMNETHQKFFISEDLFEKFIELVQK